ncbi:efflux RND transporter periplasmic adaptor subunit [Candidatus Dependentiae bacterium]
MNKNKIILIVSTLAILGGVFFWLHKKNKSKKEVLFKTQTPKRMDIIQYVTTSGTLKAREQITVGSLEAGRVVKILVDDNDIVKKDQTLAIIDNGIGDLRIKELSATLDEAKAALKYEEKFYNRQKQLFESKQISKDLFEQYTRNLEVLRAKVEKTKAMLDLTKRTYSYTFITAPSDGIVISKEIDLGQMITARFQATVMFVIAKDLHKMEAEVNVDEADIGLVKKKQDAIFNVDAFPKIDFCAKVEKIKYLAKIVDNVVTYGTILNIDNPELKLRPGMTTNVEIKVAEAYNALVVPNKTLRINSSYLEGIAKNLEYKFETLKNKDDDTDTVWIFENKTFKEIQVKIGVREGSLSQISSNQISDISKILYEVKAPKRDNTLLKNVFKGSGGIGKKREK